jgi:preprotein translocase subunit SecF
MSSKKRKNYKKHTANTQPRTNVTPKQTAAGAASAGEETVTVASPAAETSSASSARTARTKNAAQGSAASVIASFNEDKSTRLHINFIGHRRIYYIFSICLILTGILYAILTGGVKMSIDFKGGTIIKYSYTGSVSESAIKDIAKDVVKADVTVSLDTVAATDTKLIVIEFDKRSISSTTQSELFTKVSEKYSGNAITKYENNDVDPSMGADFFRKSIFEVLLASFLIVIYIWFRFRKIGGLPAGITAFVALLHDAAMIFVAFALFQIPLDENFIAVTLTVLGYSINDTIVVFDRIRENRVIYGNKVPFEDLVNKSINQSFVRSVNTTLATFVAITVVFIFATVFHIESIRSFALPMMVGVVTGCYSTICIAGPLWVDWVRHKEKTNPPKAVASGRKAALKQA